MELTLCMEMDEQHQMETRSASDVSQLPRNEGILPREAFWRKEKNRTPKIREQVVASGVGVRRCDPEGRGIELLPLARARTMRLHVRPFATFSTIWCLAGPAVTWLNHDRVWRDRLLVPVGSCTQRTQAIGQ
jgi:hypothetical protein